MIALTTVCLRECALTSRLPPLKKELIAKQQDVFRGKDETISDCAIDPLQVKTDFKAFRATSPKSGSEPWAASG